MTTTPRGSYVGLGLAHLVSTLVVCGLALLIPAPASSPHGAFDAALAFACVTTGDTSGGQEWAAGALESDPPDSDDNDDDDDGPDGPDHATIDGPCGADDFQTHPLFCLQFNSSPSSVARDGHSLRAPPR